MSAYAADIINIGELFFDVHLGIFSSLTLLLTTQTLGFSFAGLVHDLLVKPVAMIFPSTLVTTTMFTTLHDQSSIDMRPRLRFFTMAFVGIFVSRLFRVCMQIYTSLGADPDCSYDV